MKNANSSLVGTLDNGAQAIGCSNGCANRGGTSPHLSLRPESRLVHSKFESVTKSEHNHVFRPNLPMTVKEAAIFLGVSPQTVYLWVERKQIPHFRVMGRNIRFLKSDLRPFRAQFKQEVENGKTA